MIAALGLQMTTTQAVAWGVGIFAGGMIINHMARNYSDAVSHDEAKKAEAKEAEKIHAIVEKFLLEKDKAALATSSGGRKTGG